MRYRLRLRRYRRRLLGGMFEAFGDRPATPGILRSTRTLCNALKWAEREGIYS